jgi:hypothetical protein
LRTKLDSKESERPTTFWRLPSHHCPTDRLSSSICNGKYISNDLNAIRLQEDIKNDEWLSMRPRKLMSNPKRVPWKNYKTLRDSYRKEFMLNMMIGGALAWPLAVLVGRRAMVSQGGVAASPVQRFVHDWPNVNPTRTVWKHFRRWSAVTCLLVGYTFARYATDDSRLKNQYYTRPDLKPKAAMVNESTDYDPIAYQQLLEQNYSQYKSQQKENKKSPWYRLFRPLDADYNTKVNLYEGRDPSKNFYARNGGGFPTYHHDYSDHTN